MSRTYKHLSYEQRLSIQKMLDMGMDKKAIARALGVHHATIYREAKRGLVNGHYDPSYSEELYRCQLDKKGAHPKCAISPELAEYISELILKEKLTPAKIIDRLRDDNRWQFVPKSRNTIYNAIDSGLIPNVSRETLNSCITTVFSDGNIHLSKRVRNALKIEDGDKLSFEVIDNKIIFSKITK